MSTQETIEEYKLKYPSLLLTTSLSVCERYETYILFSRDGRQRFIIGVLDIESDEFSISHTLKI